MTIPAKEYIIGGFMGGTAISLLRLLEILTTKAYGDINLYFLLQCVISGAVGILGIVIIAPTDFKNAVTTGMAAPSILSGLTNTGITPVVTGALITGFDAIRTVLI